MIIVPDASVILKWVLEKGEGKEVSKALDLQDAFITGELELQVPTLWQYEVGNVLGLKQPELAEFFAQWNARQTACLNPPVCDHPEQPLRPRWL